MNWNRRPRQLELVREGPRERRVTTESSAAYFAMCARREAGEFDVVALERGPKGRNGTWVWVVKDKK